MKSKPSIGDKVKISGKPGVVTGSAVEGDRLLLVWVRLPSGAEIRVRGAELARLEAA